VSVREGRGVSWKGKSERRGREERGIVRKKIRGEGRGKVRGE
jgi:hypothetical protein